MNEKIGPGSIVTITTYRDGEGLWNTVEGVLVNGAKDAWKTSMRVVLMTFTRKAWMGYPGYYRAVLDAADVEAVEIVHHSLIGAGGAPTGPVEIGPTPQAVHDRASREFRALSPERKRQRMRDAGIREPELRPWLLALTGYAGSGKDTVASMLRALDPNVRTVAFADAVRELTGKLYGLPGDRDWWQREKNTPLGAIEVCGKAIPTNKPWWEIDERTRPGILSDFGPNATGTLRDLLIHVGMSMRALDPDFWLRMGLKRIEALRTEGHPVVVTDLRFANEAEALTVAGAHIVRLDRPGYEPKGEADHAIDTWSSHSDPSILRVENNGSIEDLRQSVRAALVILRLL